MIRCDTCDHPLATDADLDGCDDGCRCNRCVSLCWHNYNSYCSFDPVDWRTRALEAEAAVDRMRLVVEAAEANVRHGEPYSVLVDAVDAYRDSVIS